jgi:hypothetical protein
MHHQYWQSISQLKDKVNKHEMSTRSTTEK